MSIRKFNKDTATAVGLALLALVQAYILYWRGHPLLVAVAVSLTCVCVGLLAGIVAEVFGWQR